MKLITPLEEFNLLKNTDLATLECSFCNKHFQRIKKNVVDKNRSSQYCSNKCRASLQISAKEVPCNSCGLMVRRMLSDLKKADGIAYCSRSCAAKENNRKYPKRKPEGACKTCGSPCKSKLTYCYSCFRAGLSSFKAMTLGDYRNSLSIKGKHKSWHNVHARLFARSWNKELRQLPCQKCQYSLHVELAHIKSVSSFPDTATLWEVNAPENLLVLCRNCHWELDHGTIQLKDIPTRVSAL